MNYSCMTLKFDRNLFWERVDRYTGQLKISPEGHGSEHIQKVIEDRDLKIRWVSSKFDSRGEYIYFKFYKKDDKVTDEEFLHDLKVIQTILN